MPHVRDQQAFVFQLKFEEVRLHDEPGRTARYKAEADDSVLELGSRQPGKDLDGRRRPLLATENAGTPQPVEGVTYAKKIDKAETKIDFSKSAAEVRNHIHGLSPFPGAWCILAGARVKILKAQAVDHATDYALTFACGSGAIKFLSLQREGKAVMDAATFLRGFPIAPDTKPA